ncbi:MAG: Hpt domain-containing protein [Magnetococcales bacterium]|nr:Hpt domain-containing protein [Magnetococcales bacterium]MBF0156717.1 Hpt domain-containing protein [Magnetococcales bacterium]
MSTSSPPSLDPYVLAKLREEMGGDVDDLIEAFLVHLPGRVALVASAAADGRADLLHQAAHKLKGVAATLGAGRLAWLADGIDREAREGRLPIEAAVLLRLDEEARCVERAFRAEAGRVSSTVGG